MPAGEEHTAEDLVKRGGGMGWTGARARLERVTDECLDHRGGHAGKRAAVAWNLAGGYQRDEEGTIDPVLALHQ
jgi:hypothetical protein